MARKVRTQQQIDMEMHTRPYQKCKHCGAKVQLPCLGCQIERDSKIKRLMQGSAGVGASVTTTGCDPK